MSTPTQTIDLAQPRILAFKDRGTLYSFTIARISGAAWLRYFVAIVQTSENNGTEIVNTVDTQAAKLALLDEVLADASGYKVPDGATFDQWKQRIPLQHRITLGNMLVATRGIPAVDDGPISLMLDGGESCVVESTWTYDEQIGAMVKIGGLTHYFDMPTADQQRRYNRDSSRSVIVGGSRTSKTMWRGPQATLIKLYDELVFTVEGYTLGNQPLTGREVIGGNMDAFHKVVAISQLFAGVEVDAE